jgi:hypothetical protein
MSKRLVPRDLESCAIILAKLQKIELSSIFFDFASNSEGLLAPYMSAHPNAFSLSDVGERLTSGVYTSPCQFYDDTLFLFDSIRSFYADSESPPARLLNAMVCELRDYFLKHCKKFACSVEEAHARKLARCCEKFSRVLRAGPQPPSRTWAEADFDDGVPRKVDPVAYFDV